MVLIKNSNSWDWRAPVDEFCWQTLFWWYIQRENLAGRKTLYIRTTDRVKWVKSFDAWNLIAWTSRSRIFNCWILTFAVRTWDKTVHAICLVNGHGGLSLGSTYWGQIVSVGSWNYRFEKYIFVGKHYWGKKNIGSQFSIQISKGNVIVLCMILALPKGR